MKICTRCKKPHEEETKCCVECKEKRRECNRKYYKANREKLTEICRKYREENPEKIREKNRKYLAKNRAEKATEGINVFKMKMLNAIKVMEEERK